MSVMCFMRCTIGLLDYLPASSICVNWSGPCCLKNCGFCSNRKLPYFQLTKCIFPRRILISKCLVLGVMYKGGQYQDGRQHQGTRQQQCGRQHQGGGGLQGGGGHQGDQLNNRVRQHQVCPKVVWRAQNAKLKGPTRNQDLLGPTDFAVQNVFAFSDSGTM